MPVVRNLETGLAHDVPDGHPAVGAPGYEVLDGWERTADGLREKPKPKKRAKKKDDGEEE